MTTAAPFYGEFGWEIMMWSPFLRGLKHVDKVLCRPGHEVLYRDFAKCEEYPLVLPGEDPTDRGEPESVYLPGSSDAQHALDPEGHRRPRGWYATRADVVTPWELKPRSMPDGCPQARSDSRLAFVKLGTKPWQPDRSAGRIVYHIRRMNRHPSRNWDPVDAFHVVDKLKQHGSIVIGTTRGSACPPGADYDLRSFELDLVCCAIKDRIVVGPSSGPMCLALLAPAKAIVTWSAEKKDQTRFAAEWNPFDVPVRVLPTWSPSVPAVVEAINDFLG